MDRGQQRGNGEDSSLNSLERLRSTSRTKSNCSSSRVNDIGVKQSRLGAALRGSRRLREPVFFFDSGTHIEEKPPMPKKPGTNPKGEFAFFNVVYEDGSQRSNRRVPAELLGGLDADEPARGYILEQDREIAEKSGRAPLAIKSIDRVGAKKK
jgi:hypothetical protein